MLRERFRREDLQVIGYRFDDDRWCTAERFAAYESLLGDRFDGHIVQGHVDGVATVVSRTPGEKWEQFVIAVPADLSRYIVNQGSICVDGVSLTVGEINDENNQVTLWLIPETLAKTNLSLKAPGDIVNIEVDILAKYVERLISKGGNR